MDPFAVVILGGILGLVIFCLLLGKLYPGSGADVLDWRPARSYEQRVAAEIDDLDEMLEATNARRRRRGGPQLTEHAPPQRNPPDPAEGPKRPDAHPHEGGPGEMGGGRNQRPRQR